MSLREKIELAAIVVEIDSISKENGRLLYSGKQTKNRFVERLDHIEGVIPLLSSADEALLLLQGIVDTELGSIRLDLQEKFQCSNILILKEKHRYERNRD